MDTLLIDGVEFPPDGTLEFPYEWAHQGNEGSGDATTYLGMDGGEVGDAVYPPVVLPIPVVLHAPDEDCWTSDDNRAMAEANQRHLNLLAACRPGYDVTLTRRTLIPAGLSGTITRDTTARARFLQAPLSRPFNDLNRTVVEFLLLDGLWYGDALHFAPSAPGGSFAVDGDVRTHRMTIVLTGVNPVLTNTTTGSVLSYDGDATGGVSIEVETARVVSGSVAKWSWNQRLPFRMTPGVNVLTLSSGAAADLTIQPAYL